MDEESIQSQIIDLREAVRHLSLTVMFDPGTRLPFTQFCAKNLIYGESFTDLFKVLADWSPSEKRVSIEDLREISDKLNAAGVPRGAELDCVESFEVQHPRGIVVVR